MIIILIVIVAAIIVLAVGIGWILQIRGTRRFDERYEKMSEDEKRGFEQENTSTKVG